MIGYFAEVSPDGRYVQCHCVELPSEVAVAPAYEGNTIVPVESPPARWDGVTATQVLHLVDGKEEWLETAPLEALRTAKNVEINKAREQANASYFLFQGQRIACDALSWKDILSANCEIALTQEMPDDWVGFWKTMDNGYVAIPDVATWTLFIKSMVNRGKAHFNHSQQLKVSLAAAETPEQIAAIKWETPNV